MKDFLAETFNISDKVKRLTAACESDISETLKAHKTVLEHNQYKVLAAFKKNRLSDTHFGWTTGYGYDDAGREITERIFADVLGAESALVRTQIVNGTHALAITLFGILRPGDELISCSGAPYDSLLETIGVSHRGESTDLGSLKDIGVKYKQVDLAEDGTIDFETLDRTITDKTKVVFLQRATGYSDRPAITIDKISKWADFVHGIDPGIVCMVDNCYGEFIETLEPTDVGADVIAGSLIKGIGGGIALSGGYVAGRAELVEKISNRLTCPGIGGECGLTFGQTKNMLQGLFLAPQAVSNALAGAILCGALFSRLGFRTFPGIDDPRSDFVETVALGSEEALLSFCAGIQAASCVDAFVRPVAAPMPGYEHDVVMAAGGFVTGSTIELSADGPIREPYNVYFQGGLTYEHAKLGLMSAAENLAIGGHIEI